MTRVGVLLAAGAGSRMGTPKALLRDAAGRSFLERAVAALLDGGCASVVVVLGAAADDALALVPKDPRIRTVVAPDWHDGVASSLRAGLRAAGDAEALVVHLVDLPDVGATVVRRLLGEVSPGSLVRAVFEDRPGHPVVIGREHVEGVLSSLSGDVGAGPYLARHGVRSVECSDLASGADVDSAADLAALTAT